MCRKRPKKHNNSNQSRINNPKILGQPLEKNKIQIIKEHLEKSIEQAIIQNFVFSDGTIRTSATEMTSLYEYWRSVEKKYLSKVRAASTHLCTITGPLAPIAVPMIGIDETTSSFNNNWTLRTIGRGT